MRHHGRIIRIVVFALVWGEPATSLTGAELLDLCSQKVVSDDLACSSYVRGMADGLAYASILAGNTRRYCPPTSVQLKKIRAIVETYLREHQDQHNNEAGALAGAALYRAFPCSGSH
jgi:hypothetical protein